MANRLLDYKFTDFQGNILDSPDRIANFLAEWGQKYAQEFPGKTPYEYGFGPQKPVTTTNSTGGLVPTQTTKLGDDPRWSSPSQVLAMNFFSNPEAAKLLGNPDAVRQMAKDPGVYQLLQDNINGQAADMRSRDSGNIFTKAAKNIGTFVAAASGMSGLVGGLGTLLQGGTLANAANAGISAATSLPKQIGASFFPTSISPNAVPGPATGVTTPSGGAAIIGSGQAAPMSGVIGGGVAPAATNAAAAAASAGGASLASRIAGTAGKALGIPGTSSGNAILDSVISVAPDLVGAVASPAIAGGGNFDDLLLQQRNSEAARQGARAAGISSVNSAFTNQDDYYNRLRDSIYGYHKGSLDDRLTDEGRELKFELARRGHLGGSQEIDASADLERAYRGGLLRASDLAEGAVSSTRSADQAAKAGAIRDINADLDSSTSIANAVAQSQLAANQASDYARGQNLGDVFASIGYLYDQGQKKRQTQQATADYYARRSSGVGPASSYGGTTGRG